MDFKRITKDKQKQRQIFKSIKLLEQGGLCAFCLKGRYCAACENDLKHKGETCDYQYVNTFDHNHNCCEAGCEKCFRGVVHPRCNRLIGYLENMPHIISDINYLKNYINRGNFIL